MMSYIIVEFLGTRERCGLPHEHAYLTIKSRMDHEVSSRMDGMDGMSQLTGIIVI